MANNDCIVKINKNILLIIYWYSIFTIFLMITLINITHSTTDKNYRANCEFNNVEVSEFPQKNSKYIYFQGIGQLSLNYPYIKNSTFILTFYNDWTQTPSTPNINYFEEHEFTKRFQKFAIKLINCYVNPSNYNDYYIESNDKILSNVNLPSVGTIVVMIISTLLAFTIAVLYTLCFCQAS